MEKIRWETKEDIRCELIKKGYSMTWLAMQLGFSTTYLYRAIKEKKESVLFDIQLILTEMHYPIR